MIRLLPVYKKVAILAPSEVASRILVSKLDDFAKQEAEELGWQHKLLNPLKLEQIIEQVLASSTNSFPKVLSRRSGTRSLMLGA